VTVTNPIVRKNNTPCIPSIGRKREVPRPKPSLPLASPVSCFPRQQDGQQTKTGPTCGEGTIPRNPIRCRPSSPEADHRSIISSHRKARFTLRSLPLPSLPSNGWRCRVGHSQFGSRTTRDNCLPMIPTYDIISNNWCPVPYAPCPDLI
jgi:hypothetical protein